MGGWLSLLLALAAGLAGVMLVLIVRRALVLRGVLRRRGARSAAAEPITCSRCGYDLSALDVPRCPECGALRGFDVPLDELGLSEEEIRAGFARHGRQWKSRPKRVNDGGPPPQDADEETEKDD